MLEAGDLLELAKRVAAQAGLRLQGFSPEHKRYVHGSQHAKEVKALADSILEHDILEALRPAGLAVLSEESGYIPAREPSDYWFIVDPLDGTFNFVKGLGPCAVSIALWQGSKPISGAIYDLQARQLVWGEVGRGAYADGKRIAVSDTTMRSHASICTGFPVRFDVTSDAAIQDLRQTVAAYAKVRMLGSAAASLLHVARGSADVYSEQNIMLWDVAAGLAIVEAAGGRTAMKETGKWCYTVVASNPRLFPAASGGN